MRANGNLRRWFFSVMVVGLTAVGGWLYYQWDRGHLRDAIDPTHWVRHWRGQDLYDSTTGILSRGNPDLKEVALTIDDGPHTPTGDQLLDIFKQYNVRVTFFVVGRRMKERPDLVKRMLNEGHEVANHSQNHYRLDTLKAPQVRREINDCDINFCRITGKHLSLLRPPGVRYNDSVLSTARELGYVIIGWGCAAKDFNDVSPDFIINRILKRVENGSIILLHDDQPSTVVAMPRILASLKRDGYRFVTVSEMLSHLPNPVAVETNANRPVRTDISRR